MPGRSQLRPFPLSRTRSAGLSAYDALLFEANSFDLVTLLDVTEHMSDARVLNPAGVFAPQIEAVGLEVVDLVGGRYPDVQAPWLTPWYYYACRKPLQA